MLNGLYFKIALFYLNKVSKVKYWQYETPTGELINLSVRKGRIFVLKNDYYLLKNDLQGSLLLKDFEDSGVKIEILD